MISEIDNELLEIKAKLNEKTSLLRKLDGAKAELRDLNQKKSQLTASLLKEKKDVDKLEKMSFANFWTSLIGTKSEKLKKEKDEFSQVEYDYKMLNETLQQVNDEVSGFQGKLTEYSQYNLDYERLLNEKEKLIMNEHLDVYDSLTKINENLNTINKNTIEIKEAIAAGNQVYDSLITIKRSLDKAHGWGTFDILGGGLISDMAKHSNIRDAKAQIQNLNYLFNKFTRELKDVNTTMTIEINISDTLKFADYFFDGFISDFMVQSRINRSLDQVRNAISSVSSQLNQLHNQLDESNRRVSTLMENKKDLLIPKN